MPWDDPFGFNSIFGSSAPIAPQQEDPYGFSSTFSDWGEEERRRVERERLERERRAEELRALTEQNKAKANEFSEGPWGSWIGKGVADTFTDILMAPVRVGSQMIQGVGGIAQAAGEGIGSDWLTRAGGNIAGQQEEFYGDYLGDRDRAPSGLRDIARATLDMPVQVGLAAAGGLTPLVAMSGGIEYRQAREAGAEPETALLSGAGSAVAEGLGERYLGKLPLLKYLQEGPGAPTARAELGAALRYGLMGGTEEAATGIAQKGVSEALYGEKTPDDFWSMDTIAQAGADFVPGFFGSAVLAGQGGHQRSLDRGEELDRLVREAEQERLDTESETYAKLREKADSEQAGMFDEALEQVHEMFRLRSEDDSFDPIAEVERLAEQAGVDRSAELRLRILTESLGIEQEVVDRAIAKGDLRRASIAPDGTAEEAAPELAGISLQGPAGDEVGTGSDRAERRPLALPGSGLPEAVRFSSDDIPLPAGPLYRGQTVGDPLDPSDARLGLAGGVYATDDYGFADIFRKQAADAGRDAEVVELEPLIERPFSLMHTYTAEELGKIHPQSLERMAPDAEGRYGGLDFIRSLRDEYAEQMGVDAASEIGRMQTTVAIGRRLAASGFDSTYETHADEAGSPRNAWAIIDRTKLRKRADAAKAQAAPQAAPAPARPALDLSNRSGGMAQVSVEGSPDPISVRYALVEADEPVTSHDDQFNVRADYPAELQPRDRSRISYQEQVVQNSEALNPARLGANVMAGDGAPIIGPDGVVESGNGRMLMVRRAYAAPNERAATSGDAYRRWLVENASSFGLSPDQARSMKRPVLVRVRQGEMGEAARARFAEQANVATMQEMSATEKGVSDAKRLTSEILDRMAGGDLLAQGNSGFVGAFVQEIVPATERGKMMDDSGGLSQDGQKRVRAAVFQYAYQDADLLGRVFDSTNDNLRRIGAGMLEVAPAMAKLESAIESGDLHPRSLRADLVAAVHKLTEIGQSKARVEEYLVQIPMGEAELTPLGTEILRVLGTTEIGRSVKRIGQFLTRYAEVVEAAGSPQQGGLFGAQEPPSTVELVKAAERSYEEAGPQEQLFGGAAAAVGRFNPTFGLFAGETDNYGTKRFGMQMPELVELAERLNNGELPQVRRSLGKALGRARGRSIQLRADIFADPQQAAAILAHEIGHVADYLEDENLSRGNILGRIASLHKYLKKSLDWMSEPAIRLEVKEVSAAWRPWNEAAALPSFKKYRNSSVELYADAFSMLLNDPARLKQMAPGFYTGLMDYLHRKPTVEEAYNELTGRSAEGQAALVEASDARVDEMLREGGAVQAQALLHDRQSLGEMATELRAEAAKGLIDRNAALYRLAKMAKQDKGSGRARLGAEAKRALEEMAFGAAGSSALVAEFERAVLRPLDEAGVTSHDAGKLLFLARVATERAGLANPKGIDKPRAEALLAKLKEKLGEKKWTTLTQTMERWRKEIREPLLKRLIDSGMASPAMAKKMLTNLDYARFEVAKYLEDPQLAKASGLSALRKQHGTFEAIGNPLLATLVHDVALQRSADHALAARAVAKFAASMGVAEKAEQRWVNDHNEPKDPRDPKKGLLTYMKAGKRVGVVVPKGLADMFDRGAEGAGATARVVNLLMRPIRMAMITHNPGFAVWNLQRDTRAFLKNIPGSSAGKLQHVGKALYDVTRSTLKGEGMLDEELDMLKRRALVAPGGRIYEIGEMSTDAAFEAVARRAGLDDKAHLHAIRRPVTRFFGALGAILRAPTDITERSVKLAGWRYMAEARPGITDAERAEMVRNRIGTPNIMRQGAAFSIYNNLFLFSNVAKEGWRQSFEAMKEDPASYAMKTAVMDIAPALMAAAAARGLFGDELKELFLRISQHDKALYTSVPVGWTRDNKAVYLRFPHDHVGQVVRNIVWNSAMQKMDTRQLAQLVAETMPWGPANLSPLLDAASYPVLYAMGINPTDRYRGRDILTPTEAQARDARAWKKIGKASWNEVGSSLHRFRGETETEIISELEQVLNYPLAGSLVARFYKVSDAGLAQEAGQLRDVSRTAGARVTLNRTDAVRAALRENQKMGWRSMRAMLKAQGVDVYERESDFERKVEQERIRLFGDTRAKIKAAARGKKEQALTEEYWDE